MALLSTHTRTQIQTNLQPPLKWAGGKRWLVPHLRPLWAVHRHRRLVEPFSGGLSVSLGLLPEEALLNDINPHLVNFYRSLQDGLRLSLPAHNDRDTYYEHRERFNELIAAGRAGTDEAAQLFYYLNRTGYNGLCRFNRSGFYNVPFGSHRTINYQEDFSPYREMFRRWTFAEGDFDALELREDDFIYADPPYDVQFTQYSKDGFDWDDQVRLAEWLARHPGPVVISNQATPRVVRLYRSFGFRLRYLDAPRMISCDGNRMSAREVLALKNV